MSEGINPYAAPKAVVDDVGSAAYPEAGAVRREHLNHEASIKAVGLLYYLGGFGMGLGALVMLFSLFASSTDRGFPGIAIFGLLAVVAVVYVAVGRGLRTFQSRARIPTIVLSALGLLGFPLGTLINAYILWLVLSAKGRFIFTPEYAAIIDATPDVKYRTSVVVWILLGLIVIAVLAAIVFSGIKR